MERVRVREGEGVFPLHLMERVRVREGEGVFPLHLMERVRVRQGEGVFPLHLMERVRVRQGESARDFQRGSETSPGSGMKVVRGFSLVHDPEGSHYEYISPARGGSTILYRVPLP